ncbi:hypothetical protein EV07_1310 [Prochlorococcus sp. MIT 0603]|nr:hypothetical protein EV07_1310 [Prochlorococcus sp. MIT 0603]
MGGNVEMHDVRWVIGETIEATFPQLQSEWIGISQGLHLDSYKLIKFVNGFRVSLVKSNNVATPEVNRLWFLNFGGYRPSDMLEHHHFELVVAPTIQIAKKKACFKWTQSVNKIHKDNHALIDCLQDYSVSLKYDSLGRHDAMEPDWTGYRVIG